MVYVGDTDYTTWQAFKMGCLATHQEIQITDDQNKPIETQQIYKTKDFEGTLKYYRFSYRREPNQSATIPLGKYLPAPKEDLPFAFKAGRFFGAVVDLVKGRLVIHKTKKLSDLQDKTNTIGSSTLGTGNNSPPVTPAMSETSSRASEASHSEIASERLNRTISQMEERIQTAADSLAYLTSTHSQQTMHAEPIQIWTNSLQKWKGQVTEMISRNPQDEGSEITDRLKKMQTDLDTLITQYSPAPSQDISPPPAPQLTNSSTPQSSSPPPLPSTRIPTPRPEKPPSISASTRINEQLDRIEKAISEFEKKMATATKASPVDNYGNLLRVINVIYDSTEAGSAERARCHRMAQRLMALDRPIDELFEQPVIPPQSIHEQPGMPSPTIPSSLPSSSRIPSAEPTPPPLIRDDLFLGEVHEILSRDEIEGAPKSWSYLKDIIKGQLHNPSPNDAERQSLRDTINNILEILVDPHERRELEQLLNLLPVIERLEEQPPPSASTFTRIGISSPLGPTPRIATSSSRTPQPSSSSAQDPLLLSEEEMIAVNELLVTMSTAGEKIPEDWSALKNGIERQISNLAPGMQNRSVAMQELTRLNDIVKNLYEFTEEGTNVRTRLNAIKTHLDSLISSTPYLPPPSPRASTQQLSPPSPDRST